MMIIEKKNHFVEGNKNNIRKDKSQKVIVVPYLSNGNWSAIQSSQLVFSVCLFTNMKDIHTMGLLYLCFLWLDCSTDSSCCASSLALRTWLTGLSTFFAKYGSDARTFIGRSKSSNLNSECKYGLISQYCFLYPLLSRFAMAIALHNGFTMVICANEFSH